MDREMININANLVKEAEFSEFEKDGENVQVANFALVKKYGKGKEYTNCSVYGEKVEIVKEFEKGDLIHVFGYFKENKKGDKVYKNFIVKSLNKIENKRKKTRRNNMEFFTAGVGVLKTLVTAIGAGLGAWGVINLMEGYGNDNRATRS